MPWPQTGATQYPAPLGFALGCYKPSSEVLIELRKYYLNHIYIYCYLINIRRLIVINKENNIHQSIAEHIRPQDQRTLTYRKYQPYFRIGYISQV